MPKVIFILVLGLDQGHSIERSTKETIITVAVSGHRVVDTVKG
ncbi:MAG: hypothetical protein ABSD41_07185 [Candidatus Bathyarchaeia archaeon]